MHNPKREWVKLDTQAADLPKRRYSRLGVFRAAWYRDTLRTEVKCLITYQHESRMHQRKGTVTPALGSVRGIYTYFATTESIANELRRPIPYIVGIRAEGAMEAYVMRSGNPSNSRNRPPYIQDDKGAILEREGTRKRDSLTRITRGRRRLLQFRRG